MTAALAALSVALALRLPLPLWAVLTSVIVTQMSVGRSIKVTTDYLIGTIGGAIYGGVIAVLYVAKQQVSGVEVLAGRAWKWGFGLLNFGMVGMVMALLLAGMAQAFFERAIGGSTLMAFTTASENPWFKSGMYARMFFGVVFAAGYVVLVYDLLTAPRHAPVPLAQAEPA